MSNEEICEKARVYVRDNAAPKRRPNLTAAAFCQWVNNDLLPNSTLALRHIKAWVNEFSTATIAQIMNK